MLGPNSNDDHPPEDVTAGQELILTVYQQRLFLRSANACLRPQGQRRKNVPTPRSGISRIFIEDKAVVLNRNYIVFWGR